MKNRFNQYDRHQEISQLLPWYVNKTLQGTELKEVEEHLSVCLVCKREQIELQKLAQVVIQSGSFDSAEQASFSRLKKRLHSGQQNIGSSDKVNQLGNNRKQSRSFKAFTNPALAMAAAILLSLTLFLPKFTEIDVQQSNNFRTLSDAQQESSNLNEIRVVFAENVDTLQKTKILASVQGQFIDKNPTPQGVYTVSLNKGNDTKKLQDAIKLLRGNSNVIFVEPAYALLSSKPIEK